MKLQFAKWVAITLREVIDKNGRFKRAEAERLSL